MELHSTLFSVGVFDQEISALKNMIPRTLQSSSLKIIPVKHLSTYAI
jgi:hypothetical protein